MSPTAPPAGAAELRELIKLQTASLPRGAGRGGPGVALSRNSLAGLGFPGPAIFIPGSVPAGRV